MIVLEIARFTIVGALSVVINTLIIVALTEFAGLHYLASYFFCFVIVTGIGYLLNRNWTFEVTNGATGAEGSRYFALSMLAVGIAMFLTWAMVGLGAPYYLASMIAAALMAPYNFVIHRVVSFRLRRPWT